MVYCLKEKVGIFYLLSENVIFTRASVTWQSKNNSNPSSRVIFTRSVEVGLGSTYIRTSDQLIAGEYVGVSNSLL